MGWGRSLISRQFGGEYDGDLVAPRYSDYRDAVVAMVEDVVRVKFQGKSPKTKR